MTLYTVCVHITTVSYNVAITTNYVEMVFFAVEKQHPDAESD